jgi:hypothetical protein
MTFRVGRHLGRTIYQVVGDEPSESDRLIGMMDTPEIGAYVVEALNTYERVLAAREKAGINATTGEHRRVVPADQIERAKQQVGGPLTLVPPLPGQLCYRVTWHDCPVTGNWSRH